MESRKNPKIWAIGDLHLQGGHVKPMDVFGPNWKDHFLKISADWREKVSAEDIVLIPGDISWAMQLAEALPDLNAIAQLPGHTVILKGNHDYWWCSLTQLRSSLPENITVIQNDAWDAGFCVFCGTRGWGIPGSEEEKEQDVKIYRREVGRLEMSLKEAKRIAEGRPVFALMHYPPVLPEMLKDGTDFTRLLTDYGVTRCVYGHLHGQSVRRGIHRFYKGVRYDLVSCDSLDFKLLDVSLDSPEMEENEKYEADPEA